MAEELTLNQKEDIPTFQSTITVVNVQGRASAAKNWAGYKKVHWFTQLPALPGIAGGSRVSPFLRSCSS